MVHALPSDPPGYGTRRFNTELTKASHSEHTVTSYFLLSWSKNSLPVMEHEGSLPGSQRPATGPYPEPDASSPTLAHPVSLRTILISGKWK